MAKYSSGGRATGAGSTTLPTMTLYSTSAVGPRLREIAMFNTTATACVYELVTFSTAGTQGSAVNATAGSWDPNQSTPVCVVKHASTGTAPTIAQRLGILFPLAGAIGSGVIRQFEEMQIALGTGNGYGLIVHTGTGQVCDIDWTWRE